MSGGPREINAITLSNVKREVKSLKSEMRALRTGHLTGTVARAPWSPEEKHRHATTGVESASRREAYRDRHPRRVYSGSCAFDYTSVPFKEADVFGRGPRGECFCRVVPRKGQRLKELETSLSGMRARYPSIQVRSVNEEALRHVLTSACEQTHIDYSNTRVETPPSNGRSDNSCVTANCS